MRGLLRSVFCLSLFLAIPAAAAEPTILVIKVESIDGALRDLEELGLFDDPEVEREQLLREMLDPLAIPLGSWLDRHRPAYLLSPQEGLMGRKQAWTAVLPLLDSGDALRALGGSPDEEPLAGVHTIEREGQPAWHVTLDDDYMVVGTTRDIVAELDRSMLESLELPPGSIGFDLDLETLTPIIQGALTLQREMVRRQLEEHQDEMQDPRPGMADPRSVLDMIDFSYGTLFSLLANVSHLQLSFGNAGEYAMVRSRLLPTADSELETLLRNQPMGFPRLARAVPQGPAMVAYAGNLHLTDGLQEGLAQFLGRYAEMMERLSGVLGEDAAWMQELMGSQIRMSGRRLECTRGDSAGIMDFGGEEGFRSIQLSGVPPSDACASLAREEVEAARQFKGPDGEPLVSVTEPAVRHRGVEVMRVELDMEQMLEATGRGQDESGAELMDVFGSLLGGPAVVSYFGQADDVLVSVSGPDAERAFADTLDRLYSRRKRGGLSPEAFAPLEAGAGFFAVLDLSRLNELPALFESVLPEEDEGEPSEFAGRVVFGAHSDGDGLALDLALPAELLRAWVEDDENDSDVLPPGLWPPPPAPAEREEERQRQEAAAEEGGVDRDDVLVSDGEEVTLPEIVHKTNPDYPEIMRAAGLEGRIILQAIVTKEGTVRDLAVLQCDGKHPDEPERREKLHPESMFCTTFADAAIEAVERWRYEPARRRGEPVDVYFTVRVDFELQ